MADLGPQPARLVVQSDRRLVREALAAYFGSGGRGFTVVGMTGTPDGLRTLCALRRPDACLVDVETLSPPLVRTLGEIRAGHPGTEVVVAYRTLSLDLLAEAVRAGVTSFVPSSRGLDAVVRLLRHRTTGERRPGAPAAPDGHALTERELRVVSLMSTGHTVADIARVLRISPHTVDNHKRRVYAKFGVGSQSLAVARAVSLGLVEPPSHEGPAPSAPGCPLLVVLAGPAGPALDGAARTLVARGLPYVQVSDPQQLDRDHWARWHRGPVVALLVDPERRDWVLPARLDAPAVVVHSGPDPAGSVPELLEAGASAVLRSGRVPDDLPGVLTLVARGYLAVGRAYAADLAGWAGRGGARPSALPHLTAREQDILRLLGDGQTIRQAARTLGIADKTVENTQSRLYRKLGTRNRSETLAVAYRLGLLPGVDLPDTPDQPPPKGRTPYLGSPGQPYRDGQLTAAEPLRRGSLSGGS